MTEQRHQRETESLHKIACVRESATLCILRKRTAKTPEHLASRGVPPLPCPVGTLCPFSAKSHIECPAAEPNLDSSSHPDNYTWERQMQTLYLLLSCVCSHFHSLLLRLYRTRCHYQCTRCGSCSPSLTKMHKKDLFTRPHTHTPGRSSTWVARGG